MKVAQFIELINNPTDLSENHLPALEKMLADYPFFQSAHLLYTKALHNSKHINYHQALKKTAVIAGNRLVLYRLLHKNQEPSIKSQEPKVEIQEPVEILEAKDNVQAVNVYQPTNVVYTLLKNEEPNVESQEKTEEKQATESILQDTVKPETLDQIVLQPIVEAYIETEILKITEKEPEIKIDEPRSFTQWLQQVSDSKHPANENKKQTIKVRDTKDKVQSTKKQDFLDKLLSEELRISKPQPDKNFFAASQKTRSSVLEDENLVTETLAKIYVLQGNQPKAIRAYEILSLKFPEKSAYFAALINDLKNNLK